MKIANEMRITGFFTLIMMIFSFGPLQNQAVQLELNNPGIPFYGFLANYLDLILLVLILAVSGLLISDIVKNWL